MLSCRLISGPLWLGIYLFLWWFLLVLFGLLLLHWRYELPCQDKLPEFHYTPILGCIRVLWLVFHPLGLELDKALFGWNSVNWRRFHTFLHCQLRSYFQFPSTHISRTRCPSTNRHYLQGCLGPKTKSSPGLHASGSITSETTQLL